MKAASIEFRNVTKRYGDVAAVSDISFSIAAGTLVTLLGPSGCGKTTTLRMIAGLELPTAGTIFIGGRDGTRRVHGVPELCAVPAYERAGKRELWLECRPAAEGARRREGARRARDGWTYRNRHAII